MDKIKDVICPDCGNIMIQDERQHAWAYRGHTYTFMQPGLYCTKCDNCHVTVKEATAAEKGMLKFHADVDAELHTLLTPSEIKKVRESLGLTQKKAGQLFGGGPMAFSRYERGRYKQPLSTDILLRLLAANKIALADLEKVKIIRPIIKKPVIATAKTQIKSRQTA